MSGRHSARLVVALLVGAGAAVVAGAAFIWPTGPRPAVPAAFTSSGMPVTTVAGQVQSISTGACGGPGDTAGAIDTSDDVSGDNGSGDSGSGDDDSGDGVLSNRTPGASGVQTGSVGSYTCERTRVAIRSGPDRGRTTTLEISGGPGVPDLRAGDQIRLARAADSSGRPLYDFADFSRGVPLGLLAGLFALVIVAVARWRGFAAIAGLGITFAILLTFAVPALAQGENPVAVAVVASAAVLFAVVYLAHGISFRTSSALLGTLLSLGVTAALSYLAVHGAHLTGLQNEQNTAVQSFDPRASVSGLLVAGFIIGSLGVLNDVTVSQASTVFELAGLDPDAGARRWFTGALRVGRDHIASAVYTLALAYAGSALPILLLFDVTGRSVRDVVTGDLVADELLRALVGGVGLVLAVPLTTAIAAVLAGERITAVPSATESGQREGSAGAGRMNELGNGPTGPGESQLDTQQSGLLAGPDQGGESGAVEEENVGEVEE